MKKIILLLAFVFGILFAAEAQQQKDTKFKVSIGAEFAYPTGEVADYYGSGYGAFLQGEYKVLPKLNVLLSVGYFSLNYDKTYRNLWEPWLGKFDNTVVFPAKAGVKYLLVKNFYAAAAGGVVATKDKTVTLAFDAGVGNSFPISDRSSLDLGLKFEIWDGTPKTTFVGLKAAYSFGF